MNKTLLLIIIGIVAIGAIVLAYNATTAPADQMINDDKMMEDNNMPADDKMMDDDSDTMMKDDDSIMEGDDHMSAGSYETYDSSKLALANNGDVVLFFHAPWCPTCRALDTELNASLNNIPENLTILKTDYDSETQLKQKYGITYQHTLVQVDANGNLIKKWSGSRNLSEITNQLN